MPLQQIPLHFGENSSEKMRRENRDSKCKDLGAEPQYAGHIRLGNLEVSCCRFRIETVI